MYKQEEKKCNKNLIKEVLYLIRRFIKPYKVKDSLLEIPKSIKQMGVKVGVINLIITITSLVFAFMLKASNFMIESRMILLGIILFMLYRGQSVVREAMWLFETTESKKFDLIFENEIVLRGSQIIGQTAGKVLKFDSNNSIYRIMNNESMLNTIKNYLQNLWKYKVRHSFEVLQMVFIFAMLIIAVLTNTAVDQLIFIPLILIFVIISFLSSAYISLNREVYYKKSKDYRNTQSVIVNDLLRVPLIVKNDIDMRISKFSETVEQSNKNVKDFHKKHSFSKLFVSSMEALSQYGVMVFYLLGVRWENINLGTIAEIAAVLVIVENALWQVSRLAETMNNHSETMTIIEREELDMLKILEVYHLEEEKNDNAKKIESIKIPAFSIRYLEESKNDKPFTLSSEKNILLERGEIAILYGPSGSGKSTFMKMLTERIKIEKTAKIPSTSRYMFFDEKLCFGSLSLFDEIFCCTENPDLDKMQEILINLHLWSEIKNNCIDVWRWMREKSFDNSLSNGQKQRLILAKMLYWLDDEIDVLVLDECTSGLDDKAESDSADAERVLEYIVRYANSDKKRIVIISTHQNIDGFKRNLEKEFKFRKFFFQKERDRNLIIEI